MKWGKAAIVLLDPDDAVIRRDAIAWKFRYNVPDHLCFSIPPRSGAPLNGFTELGEGSLSFSDLSTKIIIVSHGLPGGVEMNDAIKNPGVFSDYLKLWGLQAVGLLTFRGCLLGQDLFLERLGTMLSMRRISVGWLIGYRHRAWQWRRTWHECSGRADAAVREATWGAQKLPDSERVKIVKGNCNVVPPNAHSHRYPGQRVRETTV